ncbi:response regulator [Massilia sp. PAMC28688]|nr:response regulator [Massilia sp. PAMC28688]
MRAALATRDWSDSPLGPPARWPAELVTVVNLMLNSRFPMFLAWGPELALLYNDGYAGILGNKHPAALGQRFDVVWAEIWHIVAPIAIDAMAGRSSYYEDLPLTVLRHGEPERASFTFSYSPIASHDGSIGGMYCAVVETTAHVETRHVQAFQLHLSDRLRPITSPDDIIQVASEALGRMTGVERVLYAEVDDERGSFSVRRDWMADEAPSLAGDTGPLASLGQGVVEALRAGRTVIVNDVGSDPLTEGAAAGYLDVEVQAIVVIPLVKSNHLLAVLAMHSAIPRKWTVTEIQMARETAERTWSAVESAHAQDELREANRRKDEFLAMLAHELRNPLAPISAAAELMELAPMNAERVRQTSQVIGRQVRHMTGLVDDLLDVSRVTRGQVTINKLPQDLKNVVTNAVEQVRPMIQARSHHLTLELPPQAAQVLGDENRLVQVLTNLLNNAAKYTPEGGHIKLHMHTDASDVVITVSDNGIGIPAELQPRVFDLFAQAERTSDRSQGGLGLGLALVKSLVGLHGGSVTCASEGTGKGSCFTVRLPRFEPLPQVRERRRHPRGEVGGSNHRIMVVDDNEDAATMLGMLLEASGHEVQVEHRSPEALALAAEMQPGVCILDIGLPDMDGYELARQLRRQPGMAGALLIAVTGYGQESDRRKALDAGFDHHMVKPVDAPRLLRIVAERSQAPA